MRISLDVPFYPGTYDYRLTQDAARQAVEDVVDLGGLHDLDVVCMEPATSPAKTATNVALSPASDDARVDVTVTFEGSAYCVQELRRRWEENA